MLKGFKVLDLTDETGYLCGKILAELGADVVKIEKPDGDAGRKRGPFYRDTSGSESSLFWTAYNMGKRGITLNVESEAGIEILTQLIKKVDFLIESYPPDYLEQKGLNYTIMNQCNQRIIVISITPFGKKGPYKDYRASDLVVTGMSGFQYLCGDPDRPPVRISFPQAYLHASTSAAAAAMIAHFHREATGKGQHVDVSAQQCIAWCMLDTQGYWDMNRLKIHREGSFEYRPASNIVTRRIWQCKDGYLIFWIIGGFPGAPTMSALVEWMQEKGMSDERMSTMDWNNFDLAAETQDSINRLENAISSFFLTCTKAEILENMRKRNMYLRPLTSVDEVLNDDQLEYRGFWQEIDDLDWGRSIKYPGPFCKPSLTPLHMGKLAPYVGQHNYDFYIGEFGMSQDEYTRLKKRGVV